MPRGVSQSDSDVIHWLETALVGPHLSAFVRDLKLIGPKSKVDPALQLDQILDLARQQAVVNEGLSVLEPSDIHSLLEFPDSLFQLQDVIAESDSPYWNDLALAAHPWKDPSPGAGVSAEPVSAVLPEPSAAAPKRSGSAIRWVALAVAVILPLFYFLVIGPPAPKRVWEWTSSATLAHDLRGQAFATRCANSLEADYAKFKPRGPSDTDGYRQCVDELLAGCDRVVASIQDYRELEPEMRKYLVQRCAAFRLALLPIRADSRFAGQLDTFVEQFVAALRSRTVAPYETAS